MSLALTIRNRQKTRAVDSRLFRRIVTTFLDDLLQVRRAELGIVIVAAPEITRLNETFLRHAGSTDVIAFDYSPAANASPSPIGWERTGVRALHGEIFICINEAIAQAHRYRTSWQSELVRYVVHGVLHLRGFDDHRAPARRRMKREEARLLRQLAARFPLSRLARKPRLRS